MPAVEAMTAGVPVIAANRGALPEAVGAAGLLVDPDDAAALAGTIAARRGRCRATPIDERSRLAQAASFSWRAAAEGVRNAWGQARAARRRRRG